MSKKSIPYINIESNFSKFEEHLDDEFNDRILFSAPFGSGKSTFLKDFFAKHPTYIPLKLYPINYSIALNQDVFELIKYDLLYELLRNYSNDVKLKKEEFSQLLLTQMFILNKMKLDLPLKLLLKAASVVSGKKIPDKESVDLITEAIKNFSDYKAEVDTDEYALLNKYVKSFRNKVGHAHESDEITELIIRMVDDIKSAKLKENSETNYKTVLLIDDLDRLDPEHVFRLFNVFSAHYDDITETNKFGFDKIIFVCDVNNIAQMFHHRYGINVDFTGYIDKYYSSEIFKFNVFKYLKESLKSLIESRYEPLKYFPDGENQIDKLFIDRFDLKKRDGFYDIFEYVLNDMIDFDIVRFRNFQRFKCFALPNQKLKTKFGDSQAVFFPLIVLLLNLERLFPRAVDLEKAFELLYKNYPSVYESFLQNKIVESDDIKDRLIQFSIQFLVDHSLIFGHNREGDKEYTLPYLNENGEKIFVIYTIDSRNDHRYKLVNYVKCTNSDIVTNDRNNNPSLINPNPYWFLYNAYKKCKVEKFL